MFFLNVGKISKFHRPGSNIFHSKIVDRKKKLLKKLCFPLRKGMLCTLLGVYEHCFTEIKVKV